MVRHYQKKNILRQWDDDQLRNALAEIKKGSITIRGAAKKYTIPKSTLHDYVKGNTSHTL